MLRSFFEVFRSCINLVCIISEEAFDFPRESAEKVSQKCHEVGTPALFKAALTQRKPGLYKTACGCKENMLYFALCD